MDFFQAQDRARGNSRRLVWLFLLALAAIIVVIYVLARLLGGFAGPAVPVGAPPRSWWDPGLFALVATGTLLLVSAGSLYKVVQLARGGGPVLAASLGGRPVSRDTSDLLEQRLLNVVDEMAIAAGVPVPRVFVLREESAINAFAAGSGNSDAVVAVTRGALERLNRDELQGVVAHEFSHIFNGDMGLNLRLIGLLNGILLIALLGQLVLRGASSGRSRNSGGFVLLGLALIAIGYIGVFFGRLIKAAVSRQREFLADASAVQYTRNPAGITGALKKLAGATGSRIAHPSAESASHMFFGSGVRFWTSLLATHPPLEERIRRLDPAFAGGTPRDTAAAAAVAPLSEAVVGLGGAAASVTPDGVRARVGGVQPEGLGWAQQVLAELPDALRETLRQPQGARAVLLCLLAAGTRGPETVLRNTLPELAADELAQILAPLPALQAAGREARLPLVQLAIPALQELPREARIRLRREVAALVRADNRVSLFEFALESLLDHALELLPARGRAKPPRMDTLRDDTRLLLSLLAHAGSGDPQAAREAFARAAGHAPLDGNWELAERDGLSLEGLDQALARLATTNFRFKGGLIEACVAAIAADGQVKLAEAELLQAIGARLGCPVPPLLPGPAVSPAA